MSKVQVFDPPMCCSTGVCGPQVDPALVRFAADLETLKARGVEVERYNLSHGPAQFVENTLVAQAMRAGADLPYVIVDGKVVAQGHYPDTKALMSLVGLETRGDAPDKQKAATSCCSPAVGATVSIGAAPKKCC